jgi:hypothetical protein
MAGIYDNNLNFSPSKAAYDNILIQSWGDWISKLYPWDIYGTFTFRGPSIKAQAMGISYVTDAYANAQWQGFIKDIEDREGNEVFWVRVKEMTRDGVLHYHGLLGDISLEPHRLSKLWYPRGGIAEVRAYDGELGAAWYISKSFDNMDFSSNLTASLGATGGKSHD